MDAPDLVLVGGPVFRRGAVARVVEVTGDRITGVGSERDLAGRIGRDTDVIDLGGRMVVPGFGDAHVHPLHGGLNLLRCDLHDAEGAEHAAGVISSYASDNPDLPWVVGGGWKYEWYERGCPSAEDLDRLVGSRPTFLSVADGHSGWANRAALALAGIDASTPDPPDGRIERNPDGSPQGTLHEGAMDLVERHLPPDTPADLERGLLAGIDRLVSLGITNWQDAIVEPHLHALYRDLAARGDLPTAVRGALWWERDGGLDQVEAFVARRDEAVGGYLPGAVKLMLDGVCENFTASMLEPYLDEHARPGTNHGIDMIDPERLGEIVTRLDALGFQCHFHAIGDAAVRHALDSVEAARRANGWADLRHTIAHLQVVHPEDLPRFRRLGVVANLQPLWAQAEPAMTELTIPFLGDPRAGWQYPFGSLLRSGAPLAIGSDWPVSTADVPDQLDVAVTRAGPDRSDPFLPEERLDLVSALSAATEGSAHVNHLDDRRGRISTGSVADLVVLDRDPFEADRVADTLVDLTILGGRVAYERR
jgi:predicted amidohydrolase YtcJ